MTNSISIYLKYLKQLFPFFGAVALSGCQADLSNEQVIMPEDASVEFKGVVKERVQDKMTRALTQDPIPVNFEEYGINFYIQMEGAEAADKNLGGIATYYVPSGFEGQLRFKEEPGQTKLNWNDATTNYNFWSWTVPWLEPKPEPENPDQGEDSGNTEPGAGNGSDSGDNDNSGDSNGSDNGNDTPETRAGEGDSSSLYTPSLTPLTFELQDTNLEILTLPGEEGEDGEPGEDREVRVLSSFANGEVLETLIGAKTSNLNFKENGRDVLLQFRHLVSRIIIGGIEFLGSDGSNHADFPAEITFVNMPTKFTVYPHPDGSVTYKDANGKEKTLTADGNPVAVTDFSSGNPDGGLKFTALNRSEDYPRDAFYICPELDFSQLEFFVDIKDPNNKYNTRGTYWGNFKNVIFEREPGTDYSNSTDDPDYEDDSTILHAGEEMIFYLVVQQYGGGGTTMWIREWSSGQQSNAGHHVHNGIYEDAEAKEFFNRSGSQSSLFELYGEGNTTDLWPGCPDYQDNKNIFRLYGDIGDETPIDRYTLPVDNGYILDGMGYKITLKPSGGQTEFTLGMMRDIYISNGDYTIYINKNGEVLFENKEGDLVPTDIILNTNSTKVDLAKLALEYSN